MRIAACVLLVSALRLPGQDALTLRRAVEGAASYPSLRAGTERVNAAAAGIRLARTAYLPRLDGIAQVNRATRNNIFGMLLPQSVLPSISGPPFLTNSLTSVWGSAVGVAVSWEPFDFGLRKAHIELAAAERERASAAVRVDELEVRAQTADAFLTTLAAEQTVRTAQAAIDRARTVSELVEAQVKAELRPGADASRARAELAAAQNQLLVAQRTVAEAKAGLSQYINAPAPVIAAGPLLSLPSTPEAEGASGLHPRDVEQQRVVDAIAASLSVLDRSWYPRFNVQGASYARGSGAMPDGTTLGGVNGLGPNIHNWGAGFTVTFPALEFAGLGVRKEIEQARSRAETARLEQVRREIAAAVGRARAQAEAARQIAANMPAQLEAARSAEEQATARYKAGLGTLAEVAEAQRLVSQSEIEDALARLNVWRSMLAVAWAQGDLEPFLKAAGQ